MPKKKHFIFFALPFLFSVSASAQGLSAKIICPENVTPGTSVIVTLEIDKPYDLQSYATFKQELPAGFSVQAAGIDASFVQESNVLKINWIRLPLGEEISLDYTLHIPQKAGNHFWLGGSIIYSEGSNQGVFTLKKKKINTVKITDNKPVKRNFEILPQTIYISKKKANCKRSIKFNAASKAYECKLNLTKIVSADYNLCEKIPSGYKLQVIDAGGAEVLESKRLVQFFWKKNNPRKNTIVIYKLIPKKRMRGKPIIYGKLSLLKDDQIINLAVSH